MTRREPPCAVQLITPGLAVLDAAVAGPPALEEALGCEVADGWYVFEQAVARVRDAAATDPSGPRWGTRLFVVDGPRTLVGWGGFKGPPQDGAVEIGYAVAPAWEGRGIATAAVTELVREAFAAPEVREVIAHTLPETGPSVRVLGKSGFVYDGVAIAAGVGTTWRFRVDRG